MRLKRPVSMTTRNIDIGRSRIHGGTHSAMTVDRSDGLHEMSVPGTAVAISGARPGNAQYQDACQAL